MRKAIYAGSFDPITNGHIGIIREGVELFDHLYVAIGVNPSKKTYFTERERLIFIADFLNNANLHDKVTVIVVRNRFLVDVAAEHECKYMLRGLRDSVDLNYEMTLKNFNDQRNPDIKTVFMSLPSTSEVASTSSSIVKGLVGIDGWEDEIKKYTTPYVIETFKQRLAGG
jgi:pantetheine-phosphate adenylyltransferase